MRELVFIKIYKIQKLTKDLESLTVNDNETFDDFYGEIMTP